MTPTNDTPRCDRCSDTKTIQVPNGCTTAENKPCPDCRATEGPKGYTPPDNMLETQAELHRSEGLDLKWPGFDATEGPYSTDFHFKVAASRPHLIQRRLAVFAVDDEDEAARAVELVNEVIDAAFEAGKQARDDEINEAAGKMEGGTIYGEAWVEGWTVRNTDFHDAMTGDAPTFTEALKAAAKETTPNG